MSSRRGRGRFGGKSVAVIKEEVGKFTDEKSNEKKEDNGEEAVASFEAHEFIITYWFLVHSSWLIVGGSNKLPTFFNSTSEVGRSPYTLGCVTLSQAIGYEPNVL